MLKDDFDALFRRGFERARNARTHGSDETAVSRLMAAFPSLADAPDPSAAGPIALWAWGLGAEAPARQAAAMVLHVWREDGAWTRPVTALRLASHPGAPLRFEPELAAAAWDAEHLGAYHGWRLSSWHREVHTVSSPRRARVGSYRS